MFESSDVASIRGVPTRRDFLRGALGVGGTLALAGCAPQTGAPAKPGAGSAPQAAGGSAAGAAQSPARLSLNKVRILYNVPQDPTFVADLTAYKKLRERYGIEVEVQEITGADASIKTLIAGQAEFALSTMAAGIQAVGQSQTLKAAIPAFSAPYFTFLASSDVADWRGLAGKRIGITATSDSSYFTTLMQLKKYGVDPASVEWITVRGVPARMDAMRAGKIDGSQATVGLALEMLKDPKYKRLGEIGRDFPNLLFSAYWVTDRMIQNNPDVIQAFAEVLLEEQRNVQDKAKFMTAARSLFEGNLDEATLSGSYDILIDTNIWDTDATRWRNDAGGEFTSQTLAEYGAVERYVPFDQWATTRFADAARQKLGPFRS